MKLSCIVLSQCVRYLLFFVSYVISHVLICTNQYEGATLVHLGELKYAGYADGMKITCEEHESPITFQVGFCSFCSYTLRNFILQFRIFYDCFIFLIQSYLRIDLLYTHVDTFDLLVHMSL